jgi:hypothetical protein
MRDEKLKRSRVKKAKLVASEVVTTEQEENKHNSPSDSELPTILPESKLEDKVEEWQKHLFDVIEAELGEGYNPTIVPKMNVWVIDNGTRTIPAVYRGITSKSNHKGKEWDVEFKGEVDSTAYPKWAIFTSAKDAKAVRKSLIAKLNMMP